METGIRTEWFPHRPGDTSKPVATKPEVTELPPVSEFEVTKLPPVAEPPPMT